MWIAGFTLFLLGLIFVIVVPINKKKNTRCSSETQGTVAEIRKRRNSNGPLPDMYVYAYRVDGIEYQTKSTAMNPQVSKVGDTCTIWYNPKKPKDAQPFHYGSAKVYNILLLVGIAMVLSGFVLFIAGAAVS